MRFDKKVWIVYLDPAKNFEAARKFGDLRPIFSKMHGSVYEDPDNLMKQARENLKDFTPGDYILMVGDTSLCVIAGMVAAEMSGYQEVNLLRWNRMNVDYMAMNVKLGDDTPGKHIGGNY